MFHQLLKLKSLDNQRVEMSDQWMLTATTSVIHSAIEKAPKRHPNQDFIPEDVLKQDALNSAVEAIEKTKAPFIMYYMQREEQPSDERQKELLVMDYIGRSLKGRLDNQDAEEPIVIHPDFIEVDNILKRMYPITESPYDLQRANK